MVQTKIFNGEKHELVEQAINDWIGKELVEVVDIKFSTTTIANRYPWFSCLVIYRKDNMEI